MTAPVVWRASRLSLITGTTWLVAAVPLAIVYIGLDLFSALPLTVSVWRLRDIISRSVCAAAPN